MSLGALIPQLAGLSPNPPGTRQVGLGGQNFTHCCMVALNESLAVGSDGNLSYAATSFVAPGLPVSALETAIRDGEFPCGAVYDGSAAGAPVVRVPYAWCAGRCGGWQMSSAAAMPQWVGPLAQFIVPSLAFCTNVPRTRKLAIPDAVFRARPRSPAGLGSYPLRLLVAFVVVTLDTVAWLAICFAFAGPMLMSAVYEYALDRKVLEFLAAPRKTHGIVPPRLRAQLLLAVVVGNIRMSTLELDDCDDPQQGAGARHDSGSSGDLERKKTSLPTRRRRMSRVVHNSVWKKVMVLVDEHEASKATGRGLGEAVSLPTKLKALLNSQASFGSTVGAPVLFFVGGFVYTVLDADNNLGDNDTAHALAFGLWWMVIPYLAIISCAMLASNSPSTLDGIVYDGGITGPKDHYTPGFWAQRLERAKSYRGLGFVLRQLAGYNPIERAFEGRFRTVKLWKRGLNKREWVQEAVGEYAASTRGSGTATTRGSGTATTISPDAARRAVTLSPRDCLYVLVGALFAVLAPCCLAFLTSYNTPQAGLSCRSLTYLVYAISQVLEIVLWSCAARVRIRSAASRWPLVPRRGAVTAIAVCRWGQVFVGFFAIFAAVGGTLMQLLGVYRSCACKVPVRYWPRLGDPDAYIVLSDNTAEDIAAAKRWWTITRSAAVGVIGIVCALAWWHQRRLRKVFRDEADKLDIEDAQVG
ncbi:hypothetical protein GGR52DRAFT_580038 [Hypoxylon sp. FL1284]|nr:hypothetical protein GGR52DRAFT_580038 [Hypoxylon sp. FL1284]